MFYQQGQMECKNMIKLNISKLLGTHLEPYNSIQYVKFQEHLIITLKKY